MNRPWQAGTVGEYGLRKIRPRVHTGVSRAQQRLTAAACQEERMAIDEKVAGQVSPREVIARAVERGVKMVDLRFTDLPKLVTVRGGSYFFLPGIRALKYLASL